MAKHRSKSEPTVRNIVIIGRTGLEKTVANHIVGQELEEKTLVCGVAVIKGVHEAVDVLYRIAIYDTTDRGLDNLSARDLSDVQGPYELCWNTIVQLVISSASFSVRAF